VAVLVLVTTTMDGALAAAVLADSVLLQVFP